MRIDEERRSMDIERRDVYYILPAYVRMYLFQSKNQEPDVITFPMFRSVPHPYKKGVMIPVEYVPDESPVAVNIAQDGSDIPEPTPESEAKADRVEEEYNAAKAKIEKLEAELESLKSAKEDTVEQKPEQEQTEEAKENTQNISPAKAALARQMGKEGEEPAFYIGLDQPSPERLAKAKEAPGGTIPPGNPSDYGGKRDARDFRRIAKDLAPEKDVREDEEIEITDITEIPEPEEK